MTKITTEVKTELILAMDMYKTMAEQLIDKLIKETNQPEKIEIEKGNYFEIQNAELINGQENLSDNWWFEVHGEHCMFKNVITGQILEISLGDKESIGNLDPYFFYNFLQTTESLKHLAKHFDHAFQDTLYFFEELEKQNILTHIDGPQFRKLKLADK